MSIRLDIRKKNGQRYGRYPTLQSYYVHIWYTCVYGRSRFGAQLWVRATFIYVHIYRYEAGINKRKGN